MQGADGKEYRRANHEPRKPKDVLASQSLRHGHWDLLVEKGPEHPRFRIFCTGYCAAALDGRGREDLDVYLESYHPRK